MEAKKSLSKLNIFKDCKEYNVGLWQCPSFVFLIIGFINLIAMVSTYFIATRLVDQPEVVALIVIGVTLIILLFAHTITQGFDKLAQANKMKMEFIGIASHQLRTPLAAMRWTLDLLNNARSNGINETLANYLQLLKENNERMIKLVNDLLDVSRIEMGRLTFVSQQTNLYILIEKTVKNYTSFAQARNVTISLDAPETLPNVWTDPAKISLVIQNLIDNAIKYTKEKGGIKVTAEAQNNFIKVSISDQGVGIPRNQQKYIFQKFFRSDNIMKHQTIGTGLGLFIAKSIIDQSKGKIWFESKEDQGTTFYFTLPIYK